MYQIINNSQYEAYINNYIKILSKLNDTQITYIKDYIRKIIANDQEYMKSVNIKAIKTEYEKQLLIQDVLRFFKPTPILNEYLNYIFTYLNDNFIDLSKYISIDQLYTYIQNMSKISAKELGKYGGYNIAKYKSEMTMKRLLLMFSSEKPDKNNSILLFRNNDNSIMLYMNDDNNEIIDIFNYKNTQDAINVINILISNNVIPNIILSRILYNKLSALIINDKLISIAEFESANKIEINHDLIINNPNISKFPNVIIIKGNLIIQNCSDNFSMQDRCSVVGNVAIKTKIKSLATNMLVGGYLDLRHSSIDNMSEEMHIKKDMICTQSNIKSLPKKLAVGGNLILDGLTLKEFCKSLYVGNDLDLQHTNIPEISEILYVEHDCNIMDSNITYIGPKTKILGTLYKNRKITISRLAEIKLIVNK